VSLDNDLPPEHEDEVLDLLRQERPQPPAGLAERVLAQVQGAAGAERLFWREAERLARQGLIASAAALLVSGGLVFWVSQPGHDPASPTVASKAPSARPTPKRTTQTPQAQTTQNPQSAQTAQQPALTPEELALSSPEQSLAALRPTLSQGLWLLPSEEE